MGEIRIAPERQERKQAGVLAGDETEWESACLIRARPRV
jgi:hypothetical protein